MSGEKLTKLVKEAFMEGLKEGYRHGFAKNVCNGIWDNSESKKVLEGREMKEKFTSGPYFHNTDQGQIGSIETADGLVVAQTQQMVGCSIVQRNYNAKLLAAAPEMYEALRCAFDAFKDIQEDGQPRGVSIGWLIEHTEKAIKKARGEE